MSGLHFTLYSRRYCHLCQDMAAALEAARAGRPFEVDVVDVDMAPAAVEARYGELVPVLVHGGREVCHYHFDRLRFEAVIAASAGKFG